VTRESFKYNPGQVRALETVLESEARFCLVFGGSRSGKTFLKCSSIINRALYAPKSKHLIVRQEASAARAAIWRGGMATLPMVRDTVYPGLEWDANEQYGYLTLPNGSEVWIGGLNDEKAMERILGNEYATIYINEASEVAYKAFLLLRSRLAQNIKMENGDPLSQRLYVDLNPTTRQHWTHRLWLDLIEPQNETPVKKEQYAYCTINPADNAANLSADYLVDLAELPAAERKRFYEGKYAEDVENALWKSAGFKRVQELPEDMERIVVAVDPATSANVGSDETGIIAMGVKAGIGYVLDDNSGRYKPEEWAAQAVALYDEYDADRIVAEKNQGGDMVESVIRAHRADVPVTLVHASGGKVTRAEPVAALYQRNKVFHVGVHDDLESQMCAFTSHFDRKAQGYSPDRVDALVWAATDLFPQMTRKRRSTGLIKRNVGMLA